jgi:hypothetical protein
LLLGCHLLHGVLLLRNRSGRLLLLIGHVGLCGGQLGERRTHRRQRVVRLLLRSAECIARARHGVIEPLTEVDDRGGLLLQSQLHAAHHLGEVRG